MLGQIMITNSSDLCCNTFDALFTKPCRWRNEWSICEIGGDQMDWIRAKNSWGDEKGYLIFGTEEKASKGNISSIKILYDYLTIMKQ